MVKAEMVLFTKAEEKINRSLEHKVCDKFVLEYAGDERETIRFRTKVAE